MTEEALVAPAPAPAPAQAAEEAAPAKLEPKTEAAEELEAPNTAAEEVVADAAAAAPAPTAPPATAPVVKEEENATAAADATEAKAEQAEQAQQPSDSVIATRLRELLEETDLEKTSVRQLRGALEEEFKCDLGARKALLRQTVDAFLAEKAPKVEEEEEEAEDEETKKRARSSGASSSSESDGDDDDAGPSKRAKAAKAKAKKTKTKKAGTGGGGFQKPLKLSPAMAEFTGEERLSRAQIVKKCWDYIKAENLQDPSDRRKILVKGKLESIFTAPITMFSMNKQISKHVYPDE